MQRLDKRGDPALVAGSRPGAAPVVGLVIGLAYLWWRSSTLGAGSQLTLSVPLLIVEIWAYIQLAFLALQTWRQPAPTPRATTRSAGPAPKPIDIAIVAAGIDADHLERTLIACRAVRGRGAMVVIDDVRQHRHRSLAADHGATYRIDRRTADVPGLAAHRNTTSEQYLWLTAGQLPLPDVLEMAHRWLDRPEVAICQMATSLLNRDDLAHLGRANDDETMVNRVLGPALSRSGAGPWLGPASVVRREAIEAVGGFDRKVPIERLTARLHRGGWTTGFERRRLVATTAPEAIDRYLVRRRHQAASALSVVFSTDGPLMPGGSMTVAQRMAHIGSAVRLATGPRLLALVMVTIIVVLTGRFPIDAPVPAALAFWTIAALSAGAARRALARGTLDRGDSLRQGWRVMGPEVAAVLDVVRRRVGPAPVEREPSTKVDGIRALAHLPLLDAVILTLDAALLARAATLIDRDLLPALPTGQRIAVLGFTIALVIPILDVLQVVVVRRQRRSNYRLPAILEATLDGTAASTVDITPEGTGILLPVEPMAGSTGTLELSLPGPDGMVRRIMAQVVVRSVRSDEPGSWRVGLEFRQLAPAARHAVVAFCARLPVLDQPGEADEATEVEPATSADRRRRSVRRVTVAAGTAGLATLIFGPGIASASTANAELVERVCVTDSDGAPVPGVVVERQLEGSAAPVGTTDPVGCIDVQPTLGTAGFVLERQSRRYELQPGDYGGIEASAALVGWEVRVIDLDGQPVPAATVRHFTDRWRLAAPGGSPADGSASDGATPDGALADATADGYHFDVWPVEPDGQPIEVTLDGVRYVRAVGGAGDDSTAWTIVLPRLRLSPVAGAAPVIDRGKGWQPAVDGMDLVPGPVLVLLAGGEVLRIEIPERHELLLPAGDLIPVDVQMTTEPNQDEAPGPGPDQSTVPVEAEPTATSTAPSTGEPPGETATSGVTEPTAPVDPETNNPNDNSDTTTTNTASPNEPESDATGGSAVTTLPAEPETGESEPTDTSGEVPDEDGGP